MLQDDNGRKNIVKAIAFGEEGKRPVRSVPKRIPDDPKRTAYGLRGDHKDYSRCRSQANGLWQHVLAGDHDDALNECTKLNLSGVASRSEVEQPSSGLTRAPRSRHCENGGTSGLSTGVAAMGWTVNVYGFEAKSGGPAESRSATSSRRFGSR